MDDFFALIIGVGADLPVTVEDASAIKNVLSDPTKGAFLLKNTFFLVEETATKDQILTSLDQLIAATEKVEKPTVVIYYSGHGVEFPDENNPKEQQFFLKTYGADFAQKEKTMLNGELFSQKIGKIKAERLLVMLDCCHADGMKKKPNILESMEIDETTSSNRKLLEKLTGGEGKVFISACDDDEESVILPGSKNSLFTEVCLEVFNGHLSPTDQYVSVVDLIYFVVKEVPKRVSPFHHKQRPIITEVSHLSPDYFVCKNGNYQPVKANLEDFVIDDSVERLDFISGYDNKI